MEEFIKYAWEEFIKHAWEAHPYWHFAALAYVLLGFGLRGGYALWGPNARLAYWLFFGVHAFLFWFLGSLKRVGRYLWIPLAEPMNTLAYFWKLLWSPGIWILAAFAWLCWRGCQ